MTRKNYSSLLFMFTNIGGKGIAAFSQLYAIFVFSKIHTPTEASLIFLLLGYAIWFQVFEFGLAQTLQNRFNHGNSTAHDVRALIVFHYFFVIGVAIYVIVSPSLPRLLLPIDRFGSDGIEFKAFSIGMAVMIIATSNQIMQRMLLVFNKGLLANALLILQSTAAILGLALYQQTEQPDLVVSVLIYLTPPVLVNFPLILNMIRKLLAKRHKSRKDSYVAICKYAADFWFLNILSAVFLGADYYFSAHYLDSEQIVSYHFTTRFYFLSFVAYYAYVHHQSRRLTPSALKNGASEIWKIMRNSALIGFASVTFVYFSVISLDEFHIFERLINKNVISHPLMLAALFYFSIRVLRDVGLVVMGNIGAKSVLYKVYIVEVSLGLTLLSFIAPRFDGMGIFLSMAFTCLVSTSLLFYLIKQLIYSSQYRLNQEGGAI